MPASDRLLFCRHSERPMQAAVRESPCLAFGPDLRSIVRRALYRALPKPLSAGVLPAMGTERGGRHFQLETPLRAHDFVLVRASPRANCKACRYRG